MEKYDRHNLSELAYLLRQSGDSETADIADDLHYAASVGILSPVDDVAAVQGAAVRLMPALGARDRRIIGQLANRMAGVILAHGGHVNHDKEVAL